MGELSFKRAEEEAGCVNAVNREERGRGTAGPGGGIMLLQISPLFSSPPVLLLQYKLSGTMLHVLSAFYNIFYAGISHFFCSSHCTALLNGKPPLFPPHDLSGGNCRLQTPPVGKLRNLPWRPLENITNCCLLSMLVKHNSHSGTRVWETQLDPSPFKCASTNFLLVFRPLASL